MIQRCTVTDWLPSMSANGSHGHWKPKQNQHDTDMQTVYGAALFAKWKPIASRARLSITLVFPQRRRRDTDNLHYRVKGVIDGIKPFVVDDDTEHLDLVVRAETRPGVKAVELVLEALE